jgi:hypothetical protein
MGRREKQIEKNAAILREAAKLLPSRKNMPTPGDIRKVLADFINDRMEGGVRVTPEWVAKNHNLARRLVDVIRHDSPTSDRGPRFIGR